MDIRSRLLPWIVPSPGALRATGMTIDMITDQSRPSHYEMVRQVHRTLSQATPAIFVGYNSIRFDEELLRQAFYQNLHPPYLTNTGGSTRADALHLVRAAAFLHPDSIIVPKKSDNGRPSYRLDMIAPANGFNHAHAHDALSDTEAVIYLCRMIKDRCPALWDRFLQFSSKARAVSFLDHEEALVVLEVGLNRVSPFIVTAIGDPASSSPAFCYDLNVDPTDLRGLSDADLAKRMGKRPSPLRKVKANQAPTLIPLAEAPPEILGGISQEEYARRGRLIRDDISFTKRLLAIANATATSYKPSPWVERQIYEGGFYSKADERRMESFHAASWEQRVVIADQFEDRRASWLARRLIWAERPELLADHHRASMALEKSARMVAKDGECGGWLTLDKAQADLEAMIADMADDAAESFRRLGAFYEGKRTEVRGMFSRK